MQPAAFHLLTRPRSTLAIGRNTLVGIISLVWFTAGISKLLDHRGFTTTLQAHGVLPEWVIQFSMAVPLVEIVLACLIGLFVANLRWKVLGVFAVIASMLFLFALTAYLTLVPTQVLRATGCGCHGAPIQGGLLQLGFDYKAVSFSFNLVLILIHLVVTCLHFL